MRTNYLQMVEHEMHTLSTGIPKLVDHTGEVFPVEYSSCLGFPGVQGFVQYHLKQVRL